MKEIPCCACGIIFSVPDIYEKKRREDHATFYCPNGHALHFYEKSEVELAREEARKAKEEASRLRNCVEHKKNLIRTKEYQVRHYKGEVTKLKRKEAPNDRTI